MRTSYSAIDRAERCLRLYAWGACDGVYEPQKKSGEDGEELHDVNEGYVRYGLEFPDTPMGRLARRGADLLPSRADAPVTEIRGEVKYAKHEFTLRADVAWIGPCGPIIGDYKSVKHFGFVPTPAKLRMSLQVAINALWAMDSLTTHRFDEATALWIFYRKPDPAKPTDEGEVKPVECVVERDNAHRVLRARLPILTQMEGLKATKTPALKVVANKSACTDYGGCWYRHKCFPEEWELSLDGKKSVPRGSADEQYREARRAGV